ncbi:AP-4-A phosphorylase [Geobacter sp. OR-1]|uniref:HIT family protein n=1 Tax=Geobacter sp. OR-1 TaxID=1266765 RepID=UPI000543ABEE|nr:HIT domain-containing protein [Geobacter sp. OR-1]GAM10043.1 AP-4-A phosphorylase [Geobacter sp. OR-1]
MERIWAPWRMAYINEDKPAGCVFCIDPDQDRARDREKLILYRSVASFIILNLYPYTNGHLMVIPYRHTSSLDDLDDVELLDFIKTLRLARRGLIEALSPQGFNIGMNLGLAGGAGVAEHLHFHIVPRWGGDTNFMTITADTRVVPEALTATYDRLAPIFDSLAPGETA